MTFNTSAMVHWYCRTAEAKQLIDGVKETQGWRDGAFDALMQMFKQEFPHWPQEQVNAWFVEQCKQYFEDLEGVKMRTAE